MIVVLFGPPGSGKGTQTRLLEKKHGFSLLSMGHMIRQEVASGSRLGKFMSNKIECGGLLDDQTVMGLLGRRLKHFLSSKVSVLLDGVPRTVDQAQSLSTLLKEYDTQVDCVLDLCVPVADLVLRLSGRRSCVDCGYIFHDALAPLRVVGVCDVCNGRTFIVREDDAPDVIQERFRVFQEHSLPVRDYYSSDLMQRIDGSQPMERVFAQIESHILKKNESSA